MIMTSMGKTVCREYNNSTITSLTKKPLGRKPQDTVGELLYKAFLGRAKIDPMVSNSSKGG
jgi:hypothetical protein